jgi:hypothetical protein
MNDSRAVRVPVREVATKVLLGVTIAGIFLYWTAVFGHLVTIESTVPGYVDWFMAFPLADLWIAVAALMSLLVWSRNQRLASVFLSAAGSALIFLGLNALLYGYRTGLLFILTMDEMIEIAIKAYCLGVGTLFLVAGYRRDANATAGQQTPARSAHYR